MVIEDFQLSLFIVCYIFYLLQIIIQVIFSTVTTIRVLLLIHRSSMGNRIATRPFVRVILLQGGLILCAMLQIVAMGCGAVSPEWEYLGLFYDVLNSLGIFLFASLAMGIYTPIFSTVMLTLKQNKDEKDYMSSEVNPRVKSMNVGSSPRSVSSSVILNQSEAEMEASPSV